MLLKPGEKTYTQRCRLFIGNLPNDITDDDFRKLFAKYGEPSEVFINKGKGFGFIRLVRYFLCVYCKPIISAQYSKIETLGCVDVTHFCIIVVGVSGPCRDCKSWVGWHPNERPTPACAVCHTLCCFVCEESVALCFQWAPGRSLFTVWNGWKGRCHCRWSWALHRQGYCWVCLQACCQKSSRSMQWGRLPSHCVSAHSRKSTFLEYADMSHTLVYTSDWDALTPLCEF